MMDDPYLRHVARGLDLIQQAMLPGTPPAKKKVHMYRLVIQVENDEAIVEGDAGIAFESRDLGTLFKLRDLLTALPVDLFPPKRPDFDAGLVCQEIEDLVACLASKIPEDDR